MSIGKSVSMKILDSDIIYVSNNVLISLLKDSRRPSPFKKSWISIWESFSNYTSCDPVKDPYHRSYFKNAISISKEIIINKRINMGE